MGAQARPLPETDAWRRVRANFQATYVAGFGRDSATTSIDSYRKVRHVVQLQSGSRTRAMKLWGVLCHMERSGLPT